MSWHEELPPPLEKDVQATILAYLRAIGLAPIRFNSGSMAGEYKGKKRFVRFASKAGVSDIYVTLRNGRAAWIEVKRRGQKPTAAQALFLAEQEAFGAVTIVATCVEDVAAALAAA